MLDIGTKKTVNGNSLFSCIAEYDSTGAPQLQTNSPDCLRKHSQDFVDAKIKEGMVGNNVKTTNGNCDLSQFCRSFSTKSDEFFTHIIFFKCLFF